MDHELTPDGESTAKWAIREQGFLGATKQLTHCARCGNEPGTTCTEPAHFRDIFKPTIHRLCDDCFDALPD